MRSWRLPLAVVTTAALLATGCSSDSGDATPSTDRTGDGKPRRSATPTLPTYDPPREFAAEPTLSTSLYTEDEYVILGDAVVYRAKDDPDHLLVSGLDGRQRASLSHPFVDQPAFTFHGLATDDQQLVFAGGQRTIEGTGTQKDRVEQLVVAYDARSGEKLWQRVLMPDATKQQTAFDIVAADPNTVLVSGVYLTDEHPGTVALDPQTGEIRWRQENLVTTGLHDGRAIGHTFVDDTLVSGETYQVVAHHAENGKRQWRGPRLADRLGSFEAPQVDGDVTAVRGTVPGGDEKRTYLVDSATGKTVKRLNGEWRCAAHRQPVVLCRTHDMTLAPALIALDATSGEERWRIDQDSQDREVPALLAVRENLAYVANDDVLTLDLRTGKDRDTNLDVPDVTEVLPGHVVVVTEPLSFTEGAELTVYRATG